MNTLELAKLLIEQPSLSPTDGNCQQILGDLLQAAGFQVEAMDAGDVKNLWAVHGQSGPLLALAGHTDVVPAGPLEQWQFDPFAPTEHDGYLCGRGAADMKTALAGLVVAAIEFVTAHPNHAGRIGLLITSCEEESTDHGTKHVIEQLIARGDKPDYCVIGEAASDHSLCDQIKIGRRGSLSGTLTIFGKQGHIAYPHLARNPIHLAMPAIHALTSEQWDQGTEFFEPTSLQFSNIHAGTGANNVIPGAVEMLFNFRYAPCSEAEDLKKRFEAILNTFNLDYKIEWLLSGKPFITEKTALINATKAAVKEVLDAEPKLSTGGGTSDGRFIAPHDIEVIEVGFINDTIHQINERIAIKDIAPLTKTYQAIMTQLFCCSADMPSYDQKQAKQK